MFRRKNPSSEESAAILDQKNLKSKINKNLAYIVKELQKEYRSCGSPVVSESNLAQHLCSVLESAFIHGLKSSYHEKDSSRSTSRNYFPKPQFWNIVLKISHAEATDRVNSLTFINTRIGKCRAWLRITLNDGAMTSYLATILSRDEKSTLTHYYDSHALLLDHEYADIFLRHLQGIEALPFELSFNSSILNDWTKTPLELAGLVPRSTSAPLYLGLQASTENNNSLKPRMSDMHRGSAPADFLRSSISRSLPMTSGDEWRRKHKGSDEDGKENSPRIEKTIDEEDEVDPDAKDAVSAEDSILHQRKLIKKRRKKSVNSLGRSLLGSSWSSVSSLESACGSLAGSRQNTPRSQSFCETLPTAFLQKKNSEKVRNLRSLSRSKLESKTEGKLSAGAVRSKTSMADRSPSAKDRKNKNLTLALKRPPNSSDAADGLKHFESFQSEGDPTNSEGSTDSRSSSNNIDTKLNSQMPMPETYKLSFMTSSSSHSGRGEVKVQISDETSESETAAGQEHSQFDNNDIMNRSSDAIDIYATSLREDAESARPEEFKFDATSTPAKIGNSLSRNGGWSAPNTPDDFARSVAQSLENGSRHESAWSQNTTSSLEETHEQVKWLPPARGVNTPKEDEDLAPVFIRREGYLRKMGEKLRQWKQRWFVLRGTTVSYFGDKNAQTSLGTIDLTDALSISDESGAKHVTSIVITMNDSTKHHLAAENNTLTEDWATDFRVVLAGLNMPQPTALVEESCTDENSIYCPNYLEEYEIISVVNTRLNGVNTSRNATMIALMGKIANEKGLDTQNYQCADCASPVGIIYGAPRVCNFTGQYYCSRCHLNEESQTPARIVHNWDFRKHKVAKGSKAFIEQVFSAPMLNMDELNPGIYKYIDEMGKTAALRQQLVHLKPYLQTCKSFDMEDVTNKIGAHMHFLDECHLYSMQDLCSINDKSLISALNKVVANGTKHVYGCALCSAKGFHCEICKSEEIIFPFQTGSTTQCAECKSVFHKECKNESCPKCERRQLRMMKAAEIAEGLYESDDDDDDHHDEDSI